MDHLHLAATDVDIEPAREVLSGWTVVHLGCSLLRVNVMFVARRDS